MPRFFVSQSAVTETRATVTGGELEHMRRVFRLRPGDRVTLFDDTGREHEGVIRSYGAAAAEVKILNSERPARESKLRIILAQALGKGEKMDLVVEKATELGVQTIVPFLSSHAVPKLDARKSAKRQERWQKIALSAAKQSGRTRIPEILELTDFASLISKSWPCEQKLLFGPGEAGETLRQVRKDVAQLGSVLLVIGPEGGWAPEEIAAAAQRGFRTARLGRRILRTETAALAAVSIAQFIWGDIE
ncbi:MAG: 16S rRNA (uracil(1498)-N(3))-methyltransferase [Candidatus Binatia bacterium]